MHSDLIKTFNLLDKAVELLEQKFNPSHDSLGRFATGGSGGGAGAAMAPDTGGGTSGFVQHERLRDRIEGTQAEADREVRKYEKKANVLRDRMAKIKKIQEEFERKVQEDFRKAWAPVEARIAELGALKIRLRAEIESSKERTAQLKSKLAEFKKRDEERKIRNQQRREADQAERTRRRIESERGKSFEMDSLQNLFGVEVEKAQEILSKAKKINIELDKVEKDVTQLEQKIRK